MKTLLRFDMGTYEDKNVCFIEAFLTNPRYPSIGEPLTFQKIGVIIENDKLVFFHREEKLYLTADVIEDIYKTAKIMGVNTNKPVYEEEKVINELEKASKRIDEIKIPKETSIRRKSFPDGEFYVVKINGRVLLSYDIYRQGINIHGRIDPEYLENIIILCKHLSRSEDYANKR